MNNISKYVQISDFILLEYEFSRDGVSTSLATMKATVATTDLETKQFFNNVKSVALGNTNNILEFNSIPVNDQRTTWYNNYSNTAPYYSYFSSFDASIAIYTTQYELDIIKLHMVSGYNFDDVTGFLLQIRAEDGSTNLVDLSNFTYIKQPDALGGSNVIKFNSNALYLGNKFYDKYVEFKVPSVQALGNDTTGGYDTSLGQILNIKSLSDVHISYSTISSIVENFYTLADITNLQLPVTSVADNFNAFIAESTAGDFIEFYATWQGDIIGKYMGDIESGRIALYTSNNPNDNYLEFTSTYGTGTAKWVIIHEINVYENLTNAEGGSSILTQKYAFTQSDNFNLANYFRPVLRNADIDASYTVQYICRLSNRMDGTQIIRKASFASIDPKKYGLKFSRLNVDNLIPYKVFNKISDEKPNIIEGKAPMKTKYVKVFYDTTSIMFNQDNIILPQGTGPLFLKNGDSAYKFKFEKYNELSTQMENVDLSGAYNYALLFVLDDGTKYEIVPTYSLNMNTTIGQLEFKINKTQVITLLNQKSNAYSIIIKNPDNTEYTFYEGMYYGYNNYNKVVNKFSELFKTSQLQKTINDLERTLSRLEDAYETLRRKSGGPIFRR